MSFFFQSVLTRSLHFSVLEISCCSIFNEQFAYSLHAGSSSIILHFSLLVNTFFKLFKKYFSYYIKHCFFILKNSTNDSGMYISSSIYNIKGRDLLFLRFSIYIMYQRNISKNFLYFLVIIAHILDTIITESKKETSLKVSFL